MNKIKLESIYLMNVVLYFPKYRDVHHFIQINKILLHGTDKK